MAHLFDTPEPISVESDSLGTPLSFRWEEKTHPVECVYDRWRIHTDWSKPDVVWFEFFKLTTESGRAVVIYHDFISGKWYIERPYD